MMRVFVVFLLIVLMGACKPKNDYKKPADLIPKDQMKDLIYDMHLALGSSNIKNIYLERNRNYLSLILEKYDVDSTRFANSNLYYTSSIDDYEDIFEDVQSRLKKLKNELETELVSTSTASKEAIRNQRVREGYDPDKTMV